MNNNKNRKIFVLDTSVLVYDSAAFRSFDDAEIVIPLIVLEELDKVKKNSDESGKNSRVAIRYIDEISNQGEIHKGIGIDNNCSLRIEVREPKAMGSDASYGDNKILACLAMLSLESKGEVILLTRDINLRIRARANGLLAEDYNKDRVESIDLYPGLQIIQNEEMGAALIQDGEILSDEFPEIIDLYPNECIIIVANDNRVIALGRKTKNFVKIIRERDAWGLMARSPEQQLAMDMIMDPKLPLVSIIGLAGGGKSLISLACGLELVLNQKKYTTFSIYRPIQSMGNDIGFLPGTLEEKLSPWFASIDDGFQYLFSANSGKKKDDWKEKLYQYLSNGTIQKEALSYIRGRSIPNSLILIDEAQNLSKEEIKTVITRVGQGSKIILTGDVSQIDAPKLDATSNGLSYVIDRFKESNLAGHVTFTKGERSLLATEATELL